MTSVSRTHLVLIPSYNTGPKLFETVNQALENWAPVWVVVDGSTDRSEIPLRAMAETDPRLRILSLPQNSGKGAAILHALRDAIKDGFTHVLTMDSDGQHAADHIRVFMAASMDAPDAVILGRPTFDFERAAPACVWPAIVEFVGECGNPVVGNRRFAFRVSRLSGKRSAGRDGGGPLDASVRFRTRGGRATVVARFADD